MTGIVRGDAFHIPLRDKAANLVVSSPPYFGQRAYFDDGAKYDGQIGSEPSPQEFLTALWGTMKEVWRVLADDGVAFINLGDKRSGSGAPGTTSGLGKQIQGARFGEQKAAYTKAAFGRAKSKQLLPERFAIGCMDGEADPDGIGWIVRQNIIWCKPNGLPESVTDRTRDNTEAWWMLVKQGSYFAAIDEIREPHTGGANPGRKDGGSAGAGNGAIDRLVATGDHGGNYGATNPDMFNPLGKLPGSVWTIPTEGLQLPAHLRVDHFAAFPSEWPRRLILGWCPNGICLRCGQGRRPAVDKELEHINDTSMARSRESDGTNVTSVARTVATITGYRCGCPSSDAPTRPAVVLDPFGGTGTTAMVARALGHTGVSLDLSRDYCRVAKWRVFESGHSGKIESRTNGDRQGRLL